jgi:phosphatidylglycerophosphate synthase
MPTTLTNGFVPAARDLRGVTAAAEKRALVWLATRVPPRVNSDHLTALGFVAILAAGASFALARWSPWMLWTVPGWLALNWLGDSLDGTLARVRDQQRPRYGFYVDHVLDAAGTLALVGGLGLSGYMSATLALAFLVTYFLVLIETYLATHARSVFRMSFLGIGATELRVVLAVGAVTLLFRPDVTAFGVARPLLDVAAVVAIAGLGLAFLTAAWRNTRALFLEEPLPTRGPRS